MAIPKCPCHCGKNLVGRQKYATAACQKRVWRETHPPKPKAEGNEKPSMMLARCSRCAGYVLCKDDRACICDTCVDSPQQAKTYTLQRLRKRGEIE
jgi:hypothetical protein